MKRGSTTRSRFHHALSLARGIRKKRERERKTHSVPTFTVFGENFVFVRNPILVPSMKSSRVCPSSKLCISATGTQTAIKSIETRQTVYTENISVCNLESSVLESSNNPIERARCVGSRENVFVHEQSPTRNSSFRNQHQF